MFDSNLEAKGSKPILKEKSVVRMVELKEVYDLIYAVSGELETYLRSIMKNLYMVWRGRKTHKILFKFREEESSSRSNLKIHLC